MPEYDGQYIGVDTLLEKIKEADANGCLNENNQPLLTIVDYRTENFIDSDKPILSISTGCKIIKCLLDDLRKPTIRDQIPREGLVVLLCETGNRDAFTMRYLSQFGYTNIRGLRFGMRGWLKAGYPVVNTE